jgi:hypothetical protein
LPRGSSTPGDLNKRRVEPHPLPVYYHKGLAAARTYRYFFYQQAEQASPGFVAFAGFPKFPDALPGAYKPAGRRSVAVLAYSVLNAPEFGFGRLLGPGELCACQQACGVVIDQHINPVDMLGANGKQIGHFVNMFRIATPE